MVVAQEHVSRRTTGWKDPEMWILSVSWSYLGKVFAHRLGRGTEIVTEGTGRAGLASALAEELARNV